MEQATEPDGRKRWWIFLTDGSRKLTWKCTAQEAQAAAERKGFKVDRVIPAGNPLEDR